jgi:hypothetical protein
MSNFRRGIYRPPAGDVPIYELEDRSRATLLVVIALVWLAAFAGVVWLAYSQGVERGRQGAPLVFTSVSLCEAAQGCLSDHGIFLMLKPISEE